MTSFSFKTCSVCGENKPLSDYPSEKKKGKVYYRHQCKTCYYGVYQKDQKEARIRLFIEYKMTCKCERCEESDWRALQFHHTGDLLKENNVAGMVGRWDHKKVMNEIEKCICLCANCHQIEHSPYDLNGKRI
jgi:hypothetical protein